MSTECDKNNNDSRDFNNDHSINNIIDYNDDYNNIQSDICESNYINKVKNVNVKGKTEQEQIEKQQQQRKRQQQSTEKNGAHSDQEEKEGQQQGGEEKVVVADKENETETERE